MCKSKTKNKTIIIDTFKVPKIMVHLLGDNLLKYKIRAWIILKRDNLEQMASNNKSTIWCQIEVGYWITGELEFLSLLVLSLSLVLPLLDCLWSLMSTTIGRRGRLEFVREGAIGIVELSTWEGLLITEKSAKEFIGEEITGEELGDGFTWEESSNIVEGSTVEGTSWSGEEANGVWGEGEIHE